MRQLLLAALAVSIPAVAARATQQYNTATNSNSVVERTSSDPHNPVVQKGQPVTPNVAGTEADGGQINVDGVSIPQGGPGVPVMDVNQIPQGPINHELGFDTEHPKAGINDPGTGSSDTTVIPSQPADGASDSQKQALGEALRRRSASAADARAAADEAAQQLHAGRYREAESAASRSIAARPSDNAEAYGLRAEARLFLKNYAGAEDDARTSLSQRPNNVLALQTLAWSKLRQNQAQEAQNIAEQAARQEPNNALAHAILAYALDETDQHWRAKREAEKAADLDAHFDSLRERAIAGDKLYNRSVDDASLLAQALAAGTSTGTPPWQEVLFGLLALLGLGAAAWFAQRRRAVSWRSVWKPLPPEATLAVPGWAGKYQLGRVIGHGGMGVVYEATDHVLGRDVAIKKMSDIVVAMGERAREAYLKEARVVASLHHPAIVDIYDIVESDREIYLVFELVRGTTLDERMAKSGAFSAAEALSVLTPVCEALEFAHRHNLVHRDLKPQNIMITDEGGIKLMDFGIARVLSTPRPGTALDRTQTVLGTPAYMAPESWQGVVCKQGDIYALGVCLYEMLTGGLPFSTNDLVSDKVSMTFERPSRKRSDLPRELDLFLERALDPKPDRRIASASRFLEDLRAALRPCATADAVRY